MSYNHSRVGEGYNANKHNHWQPHNKIEHAPAAQGRYRTYHPHRRSKNVGSNIDWAKIFITTGVGFLLFQQLADAFSIKQQDELPPIHSKGPRKIDVIKNSNFTRNRIPQKISPKIIYTQETPKKPNPPLLPIQPKQFCKSKGTGTYTTSKCVQNAVQVKSKWIKEEKQLPEDEDLIVDFACGVPQHNLNLEKLPSPKWEELKTQFGEKYPDLIYKLLSLCDPKTEQLVLSNMEAAIKYASGGETCFPIKLSMEDPCYPKPKCEKDEAFPDCIDRVVLENAERWLNSSDIDNQLNQTLHSLDVLHSYINVWTSREIVQNQVKLYNAMPEFCLANFWRLWDMQEWPDVLVGYDELYAQIKDNLINNHIESITHQDIDRFFNLESLSTEWRKATIKFITSYPKTIIKSFTLIDQNQKLYFPTAQSLLTHLAIFYSVPTTHYMDTVTEDWSCKLSPSKPQRDSNCTTDSIVTAVWELIDEKGFRHQSGISDQGFIDHLEDLNMYVKTFDDEEMLTLRSYKNQVYWSAASKGKGMEWTDVIRFFMSIYQGHFTSKT